MATTLAATLTFIANQLLPRSLRIAHWLVFLLLAEFQIIRVTNIFASTLCFEASRATRELGNGQHTASYVTVPHLEKLAPVGKVETPHKLG